MAAGDIYQVVLNSAIQDQPHSNVIHFIENVTGSEDLAQRAVNLAVAVADRFQANVWPLLSEDYVHIDTRVGRIFPEDGPNMETQLHSGTTGPRIVDSLAEFTAAVVQFRTNDSTKSGRGRLYQSGIPQTDADGSILTTLARNGLTGGFVAALADITTGSGTEFSHVVWSRKLLSHRDVTAYATNRVLGTQRRRRPRFAVSPSTESP